MRDKIVPSIARASAWLSLACAPCMAQPFTLADPPDGSQLFITGAAPGGEPETDIQVKTVSSIVRTDVDDIVFYLPFADEDSIFDDAIHVFQGEESENSFASTINFTQFPNILRTLRIQGEEDTEFGLGVGSAGDMDRNGFNDLAVLAPLAAGFAGKLYVLSIGGSLIPPAIDPENPPPPKQNPHLIDVTSEIDQGFIHLTIDGSFDRPMRETPVQGGDLDGDGFSDLVFPASALSFTDDEKEILGYVVYGSNELEGQSLSLDELDPAQTLTVTLPRLEDDQSLNFLNTRIFQAAGDITGDGVDDLVMSLGYAPEAPFFASLYIIPGGERLAGEFIASPTQTVGGQIDLPLFEGRDMHALSRIASGDLNNDGINELALSFLNAGTGTAAQTGSIAVLYGGPVASGTTAVSPGSERLAILGHSLPFARFGSSSAIRNGHLLAGAPGAFSPFGKAPRGGGLYAFPSESIAPGMVETNAPQRINAAVHGAFTDQGIGASQDFFVDREGALKIVSAALGDDSQPDRVGYILPFSEFNVDFNNDRRHDLADLFIAASQWRDEEVMPLDQNIQRFLQLRFALRMR